jgi:hypothetical protein
VAALEVIMHPVVAVAQAALAQTEVRGLAVTVALE